MNTCLRENMPSSLCVSQLLPLDHQSAAWPRIFAFVNRGRLILPHLAASVHGINYGSFASMCTAFRGVCRDVAVITLRGLFEGRTLNPEPYPVDTHPHKQYKYMSICFLLPIFSITRIPTIISKPATNKTHKCTRYPTDSLARTSATQVAKLTTQVRQLESQDITGQERDLKESELLLQTELPAQYTLSETEVGWYAGTEGRGSGDTVVPRSRPRGLRYMDIGIRMFSAHGN